MRYLFFTVVIFTQTALAKPPSFWERVAADKREGLIALQEAQYAYRHGAFEEAYEKARIAREKAPSVEADYLYGLSLFHAGFAPSSAGLPCAEALTVLQGVQERSAQLGDEPEVHLAIGLCAAVIGEYDLAIEESTILAYHAGAGPSMRFIGTMNLGDSLMAAGDLGGAIAAYTEAYYRAPSEPYVSFALAVACYRNHEIKAAATAIQQALAMDPSFDTLYDDNIIFVPEEDKLFFFAVAAAGNEEIGLAQSYLMEYLSAAPEGAYRNAAREAFLDVDTFSKQLNGEIIRPNPPLQTNPAPALTGPSANPSQH